MWDEWVHCDNYNEPQFDQTHQEQQDSHVNFDFLSLLSKPKDYYKILEVDYDATEDAIRSNYIRLALKWHPDKQKDQDCATSRFQEINEAYQEVGGVIRCRFCAKWECRSKATIWCEMKLLNVKVLSDPDKRREYDSNGMLYVYDYNIIEYLNRYKGLILTCNGLGMKHSIL